MINNAKQVTTHVSLRTWHRVELPRRFAASLWRFRYAVPLFHINLETQDWSGMEHTWFGMGLISEWLLDCQLRKMPLRCSGEIDWFTFFYYPVPLSLTHPFSFLSMATLVYFKFCLCPTELKNVRPIFRPNSFSRLGVLTQALYRGVQKTRSGFAYIPIFPYELYRLKWLF